MTFDNVFHVYLMRGLKKYENIFVSRWIFEIIQFIRYPIQMDKIFIVVKVNIFPPKNQTSDLSIWIRYQKNWNISKSHCEKKNCIFFQSTHQVDMKNIVECYKHFFGYFNALETNGEEFPLKTRKNFNPLWISKLQFLHANWSEVHQHFS